MNELLQIAGTIRRQITAGDSLALMSWGASGMIALDTNENRQGGLMFQVCIRRQRFHKIIIELTHLDEYKVTIWGGRLQAAHGRVLEETTCHCDNLTETIDGLCERENRRLVA